MTSGSGKVIYKWAQEPGKLVAKFARSPADEKKITFTIEPKHFFISYLTSVGSDFELPVTLHSEIVKDLSKIEVIDNIVTVTLTMKDPTEIWPSLEKGLSKSSIAGPPSYPTSSKQTRDWSTMDQSMEKHLETDENYKQGDAFMGLMKQLY